MKGYFAIPISAISLGFIALISPTLNMLMPSFLLLYSIPFVLLYYRGRIAVRWFFISFVFIALGLWSSSFAQQSLVGCVFTFAMFLPLCFLALQPEQMTKFFRWYVILSAIFVSGWVLGSAMLLDEIKPWSIESPAGTANLFTIYLNMSLPLIIGFAEEERQWKKFAMLSIAMLCVIAVVVLFSRAAFLISFSIIMAILWFTHRKIFVAVAVICIFFLYIYWERVVPLFELYRFVGFEAETPRSLIWGTAIRKASVHELVGVGPGNAKLVLASLGRAKYHAHNDLIHYMLEMGFMGLIAVFLFHSYIIYVGVKSFLSRRIGLYVALSLAAYTGHSLVETPLRHPELTLNLIIVIVFARTLMNVHNGWANRVESLGE